MPKAAIPDLFAEAGFAEAEPGVSASRAAKQLALLSQMVEEIFGELALEPLLSRIVERACKLIGADDGVIGLYEPELDAIRTVAIYNIPAEQLEAVLPRGRGMMGRVLELNAPVHCQYGELPYPTHTAALGMDMIGMPIQARGKIIGVFSIAVWPPRRFDAEASTLLKQFARHAAIAIGNAQRYTLEERRAARFALIVRIAGIIASEMDIDTVLQRTADAIHELLEFPAVDIPLIDAEDPDTLVIRIRGGEYKRLIRHVDRLPVGNGIMGAAARERRTQLVNDVAADARYVTPPGVVPAGAELAVPILYRNEVLGVLNVESNQSFDELDQQSLELIAEHLAMAIQGARLLDQTREMALLKERQRLARELHDNVTQILSSISMISQSLIDARTISEDEATRRARRLSELSQMAFSELRELLKELSPEPEPLSGSTEWLRPTPVSIVQLKQFGLAETTRRLIAAMCPPQIALRLDFAGYRPQALEHEEALLRICQEAASNAMRHSGAACMWIEAGVNDNGSWLSVSDDGSGVSSRTPPGMGMANMWQRLLALGGSLQVMARSPQGLRIEARLPQKDRKT